MNCWTPTAKRLLWFLVLSAGIVDLEGTVAAEAARESLSPRTALDEYVARPDPHYSWSVAKEMRGERSTAYVVDMKSQAWRTPKDVDRTVWQHWLTVVRPDHVEFDTGFLLISGGSNDRPPPNKPDEMVVKIALATNSVVAELKMVPNQPLVFHNDGQKRSEDDLIGYTWDQFLKTRDATWPARNPMVKSAVRAMDTVQSLLASQQGGNLAVNQFVVAGGSKRGWTTWLTGAVDRRVAAIVPIVIDVLNVDASMRHHYAAYGFWAPAIGDYEHHKITRRLDAPQLRELYRLVDPYCYRHRLKMPKYIVNAAGDQFFLPDSSQFYFDQLEGEKHLRYVPNADHSLDDSDALETIIAFYRAILTGTPRPEYSWTVAADGAIRVRTVQKPAAVNLWQATNPQTRDFRVETLGKQYAVSALEDLGNGLYIGKVDEPVKGWTALFVELVYDTGSNLPLKFTTEVRVVPDTLPFADKEIPGSEHSVEGLSE
jgi:PhoPQ-activated pathogenicity-related protein